jgi:hypothetical protein
MKPLKDTYKLKKHGNVTVPFFCELKAQPVKIEDHVA